MSHPLAIVVLLAVTGGIRGAAMAGDAAGAKFHVTTQRDTDKVEVKVEQGRAIFAVHSPSGIGWACIARCGDSWPDTVRVRLQLKGLESFRAVSGRVTLHASVSRHAVRLWKDDREEVLLDRTSPYWMEIRRIGVSGQPAQAIPPERGYFELDLPKAFFAHQPQSVTIHWIDFYR